MQGSGEECKFNLTQFCLQGDVHLLDVEGLLTKGMGKGDCVGWKKPQGDLGTVTYRERLCAKGNGLQPGRCIG